jgi:hypothetical protein
LTVFPSDFSNIYLKYFGILQNLTRNYEILQKFMKVYESLQKFTKVYKSLQKFTKVYESLQKFTKVYESLQKFMKVMIFHDIFSVKSLAFIPFRLLAMYFLHFVISYGDDRNFPVCYHSVLPLDNIGKYFTMVK